MLQETMDDAEAVRAALRIGDGVNRALYDMEGENQNSRTRISRIDGHPPHWRLEEAGRSCSPIAVRPEPCTIVVIDLGNCHFLREVEPYGGGGNIMIWAYADAFYNGYGVNPPCVKDGVCVVRCNERSKNAADVRMVWDLAQYVQSCVEPTRIILATKDNGFQNLKNLVEQSAVHSLTFVKDLQELRFEIE